MKVPALARWVCAAGLLLCTAGAEAQVEREWLRLYDGPSGGDDVSVAVALDGSGAVIVTGESEGDFLTAKYRADGSRAWAERYDSSAGGIDRPAGVVVDAAGFVYVTGTSQVLGNRDQFVTIKYTPNGAQEWVRGFSQYDSEASGLALDGAGNVYVTGGSTPGPTFTNYNFVIIKYTSGGDRPWFREFGIFDVGFQNEVPAAVAVNQTGRVAVTGTTIPEGSGSFDFLTVAYDTAGNRLWWDRWEGNVPAALAKDVAIDAGGNVYVAGHDGTQVLQGNLVAIKYSPTGDRTWIRSIATAQSLHTATGIAVDPAGNVFATGTVNLGLGFDSLALAKWRPDGTIAWRQDLNGTTRTAPDGTSLGREYHGLALARRSHDVVVDGLGNAYIAAEARDAVSASSGADFAVIRFDAEGTPKWRRLYDDGGVDRALSLALSASGTQVGVAGTTDRASVDYVSARYTQFDNSEVRVAIEGSGTVTSDPPGIACGQACVAVFPIGTLVEPFEVVLDAVPDPGSVLAGWDASCPDGVARTGPRQLICRAFFQSAPDTDRDGIADPLDNCTQIPNGPTIPDEGGGVQRDTDGDGFGNVCDCDFTNDATCTITDFNSFLPDFMSSSDSGVGTDMDGNGSVGIGDFNLFLPGFQAGAPGPSGLAP